MLSKRLVSFKLIFYEQKLNKSLKPIFKKPQSERDKSFPLANDVLSSELLQGKHICGDFFAKNPARLVIDFKN